MRKLIFAALGAASVVAAATPAAAQYYGQGYGSNGYGRYGYGSNRMVTVWGSLANRLDNVRRSLSGVRPDRAHSLASEANRLDRQVRFASRNNADPFEVRDLENRVGQLERRVAWASRGDGYNRYNSYDGNYGYRDQRRYFNQDREDRWNGNDRNND